MFSFFHCLSGLSFHNKKTEICVLRQSVLKGLGSVFARYDQRGMSYIWLAQYDNVEGGVK